MRLVSLRPGGEWGNGTQDGIALPTYTSRKKNGVALPAYVPGVKNRIVCLTQTLGERFRGGQLKSPSHINLESGAIAGYRFGGSAPPPRTFSEDKIKNLSEDTT